MQEEFHVNVKKEYAAKLIQQLLDDDALGNVAADLPIISKARLSLIKEERQQFLKGKKVRVNWEQKKNYRNFWRHSIPSKKFIADISAK